MIYPRASRIVESGVLAVVLLYMQGAVVESVRQEALGGTIDFVNGDPVYQMGWAIAYSLVGLLSIIHWRSVLRLLGRDCCSLALLALACASVSWSQAPDVTLRRAMALGGTTLVGVYLAARYSVPGVLRLLRSTFMVSVVLSVTFAVFLPTYGLAREVTHTGAWRGVYVHKNVLGIYMALSTVLFLFLSRKSARDRWISWTGAVMSAALLVLSTAVTSMVTLVLLLALVPLYRSLRRALNVIVPTFLGAAVIAGAIGLWLTQNFGLALSFMDRDPTLTGRALLWGLLVDSVGQRLWLGYGYQAFWLGDIGESGSVLHAANFQADVITFAHNGFIDTVLGLGLVGLGIFVVWYLLTFRYAIRWARRGGTQESILPLLVMSFMLATNITESSILKPNSALWAVFVALSVGLRAPRAPWAIHELNSRYRVGPTLHRHAAWCRTPVVPSARDSAPRAVAADCGEQDVCA